MKVFGLFLVAFALFAGAYVFAQEEPNIAFPVAELGNCGSKEECKAYCDEVENMPQCIDFAERHGLMQGAELEESKKVAHALSQGARLPGGCTSKESCELYCQEGSHIEECLAFAEAAGFMSPEELEEAKRIAPLMARGEMPGNCRSREQCEAYCSQEQNVEECAAFFERAGFITAAEAEMFRKTGGKGPGGCQGREECDAFCNDPVNQEACFAFAKEHGLIPEEELQNIEEGLGRFREGFLNVPSEVAECLRDTVGEDVLAKIEAGTFLPNQKVGEHMRQCFEQFTPRPEEFPQRPMRPEDRERFMPPPDGEIPEEFRDQFRKEFEQRQGEEFQRQFEEEAQRFQEEFQPPEGFEVPEEFRQFHEEHSSEPTTRVGGFLGAVVDAAAPALKRWLPFLPL